MTKKTEAPAPGAPLRLELTLRQPIGVGESRRAVLTVTEPTARQRVAAERKAGGNPMRQAAALVAAIADLSDEEALALSARDYGRVTKWLQGLANEAARADGPAEPEAAPEADPFADPFADHLADPFAIEVEAAELSAEAIDDLPGERTFELLCPIEAGPRLIDRLTLREPTVDALMAAAEFKLGSEITLALLAKASGETIPVIGSLRHRDISRLEAWLAPFVQEMAQEA